MACGLGWPMKSLNSEPINTIPRGGLGYAGRGKAEMKYIVSASTDIGRVKSTNQDSLNVMILSYAGEQMVFAVLCDGMGGLDRGEVASASVVEAFHQWGVEFLPGLCARGITDAEIRREWTNIITGQNRKLRNYGAGCGVNLGTTAAVLLVTKKRYYIVNVGDSRVYELGASARLLTQDQTVVAMEGQQGKLTWQEAEKDPRRSVLLQCVGASEEVCPDFFFGTPGQNMVYMLCSDGFRHEVSPEEIYAYLQPSRMVSAESMKQNEMALIELNKQRQERDNISVITIRTY